MQFIILYYRGAQEQMVQNRVFFCVLDQHVFLVCELCVCFLYMKPLGKFSGKYFCRFRV